MAIIGYKECVLVLVVKLWKIKKYIIPQLKLHLLKQHYTSVDEMMSEIYLYEEGGVEFVCIQTPGGPSGGKQCMMFYALNGAYYDINSWDYVKMNGTLIN